MKKATACVAMAMLGLGCSDPTTSPSKTSNPSENPRAERIYSLRCASATSASRDVCFRLNTSTGDIKAVDLSTLTSWTSEKVSDPRGEDAFAIECVGAGPAAECVRLDRTSGEMLLIAQP